jgi:hypothetical protein
VTVRVSFAGCLSYQTVFVFVFSFPQVRGVVNLCEEYKGPQRKYKELGIEELHLPTTDHFEPSVKDLIVSVCFAVLGSSLSLQQKVSYM